MMMDQAEENDSDGSVTSYWIKFFTDASIPPGEAINYAIIFVDNCIQKSMLLDLTKEYLQDMGVTTMGYVISILKHAKKVFQDDLAKTRNVGVISNTIPPIRKWENRPSTTAYMERKRENLRRRRTAASRIVDHYLDCKDDPDAVSMNDPEPPIFISTQDDPSSDSEEDDDDDDEDTTIGDRLGKTAYQSNYEASFNNSISYIGEKKVTINGLNNKLVRPAAMNTAVPSVFKRLGAVKRAATSTTHNTDDDSEEENDIKVTKYAGVLKVDDPYTHKTKILSNDTVRLKRDPKMKMMIDQDATNEVSSSYTEGVLSPFAKSEKPNIKQRLGGQHVATTSDNTMRSSQSTSGLLSRLGTQHDDDVSSSSMNWKKDIKLNKDVGVSGVFKRLGKPKV